MRQIKNIQILNTTFANPDFQTHKNFQAIFEAISNPGKRIYVNNEIDIPENLTYAAAAVCSILMSIETLFWTDLSWNSATLRWLQLHCGYTLVTEPCMATCVLITRPTVMPPLNHFRIGENGSPANATMLIMQVEDIYLNKGQRLAGPGIKKVARLSPKGMSCDFWEQWQAQSRMCPLGVDIFFACEDALVALPRTTQIGN
jgi:alpha-D-ribose 1-methylphosphonate 5-triphosphate synthase subunit PhnH